MNVDTVAAKLRAMAAEIEADKGPLTLLGLFLRDESPELWDIVIAAPWMKSGERDSFEYVANRLRTWLGEKELVGISRVVILECGGAVLDAFLEQFKNHTGLADVHFVVEGGAIIRRAYVILTGMVPTNPLTNPPNPKPEATKSRPPKTRREYS